VPRQVVSLVRFRVALEWTGAAVWEPLQGRITHHCVAQRSLTLLGWDMVSFFLVCVCVALIVALLC